MQEESYKGDCHSGTYGGRSIRKDLRDQQQASQEVLVEKNLPANAGGMGDAGFTWPWVRSLDQEDPLE